MGKIQSMIEELNKTALAGKYPELRKVTVENILEQDFTLIFQNMDWKLLTEKNNIQSK
jgi:hypothetical protein